MGIAIGAAAVHVAGQATTVSATITGTTAGRQLLIGTLWSSLSGSDDPTVTCSGETVAPIGAIVRSGTMSMQWFRIAALASGGSKTVNNITTGSQNKIVWVVELVDSAGVDATQTATGSGTNGSTSITTAVANAGVFALHSNAGGSATPTDGSWTDMSLTNVNWYEDGQYKLDVGAAGSKTVGFTHGWSSSWAISAVAIASVPAGPTVASSTDDTPSPGQSVTYTVTGAGASQGGSTITLGGVVQTVTAWSDTSITVTIVQGVAKYGAQNVVVTVASVPSNNYAVTLTPPAGRSYIDITSIAGAGVLETTPSLAAGDQVEYEDPAIVYADGTWSAPAWMPNFQFRAWDSGGGGWGSAGLQILMTARLGLFDPQMRRLGWF